MTIIAILSEPYNIFDEFQFMDVLVNDNGRTYESSVVEPLITELLNAELPYQVEQGNFQLKLFND